MLGASSSPFVVDGLKAATALENDLTLVTRNVQNVTRTGVKLLNQIEAKARSRTEKVQPSRVKYRLSNYRLAITS
jgi:hypothetical protein